MKEDKNIFKRIFDSICDGSFTIRIANRISPVKSTSPNDTAFIRKFQLNNPDKDIRGLSHEAKKMFIELNDLFENVKIQTVAYVGANDGKVAMVIDEAFPGLEYYLFEPVPATYKMLTENVSGLKNMHCFNLAVGSTVGYADMYMDEFLPASSLLQYKEEAVEEFPYLGKQEKVKVQVMSLDSITAAHDIDHIDFLIMDIQGYEDEMLKGSEQTLKSCSAVMSELSLQELYVGSSTFNSVYQTLVSIGFSLRYLLSPLRGKSGRILQVDGIFVRDS